MNMMNSESPPRNERFFGSREDHPDVVCLRMVCEIKRVEYTFMPLGGGTGGSDRSVRWESDSKVVTGFAPIAEYLEGRWPDPEILPYRREVLDRLWEYVHFLRKDFIPHVELLLRAKTARESFERKTDVERMVSRLETDLCQQSFLVFEMWTLADILVYPWIQTLFYLPDDPLPVQKFQRLDAWRKRLDIAGLGVVSEFLHDDE